MLLSDREFYGVLFYMDRAPAWGGDEDSLLAQAELWETGTSVREAAAKVATERGTDLSALSDEPAERNLSPGAQALLRQMLARPGQLKAHALCAARAIKRMRGE